MSGWASRDAALPGLTLPPYWMRTRSATWTPAGFRDLQPDKRVRLLRLVGRGIAAGADCPDGLVPIVVS